MLVKCLKFFSFAALAALLAAPVSAAIIVDTDFTDAEGFMASDARQLGWVGQAGTTAEPGESTATVSNAWVGITNNTGAPTDVPGQKYTATFDFKYRNFAGSDPGAIGVNGNVSRLGLTTESPQFGGVGRLGNNSSDTLEVNLNKQDGQMTFQLGGGGSASAVVTDADLGFDFSGGADDSDLLRVVFMATPTATPDTWDVMATLDNLDNPFAGGPVVLTETFADAGTWLPSSLGPEPISNNLYVGFALSGYGGGTGFPAGGRSDPLSGMAVDRVTLEALNIPEPATLAMAFAGCVSAMMLRRRS